MQMERRRLFVKYLDYEPVLVPFPTENDPLVAHLIAAFQERPGSLLANTDSGLITLHFVDNGVEITYNSWDPLTILGENGTNGANPLIIKARLPLAPPSNAQGRSNITISSFRL